MASIIKPLGFTRRCELQATSDLNAPGTRLGHPLALRQRTLHSRHSIACTAAAKEASSPTTTSDTNNNKPVDAAEWAKFTAQYSSQYKEHAFWLDESSVQGTIPHELKGTLLRNGPALYEIGGKKIPQPFDGDGALAAFSFPGEGKAPFFANRFVRTVGFVEEQQAQKMIYRGAFSVGNPTGGFFYNPFDLSIKKVANTGVVYFGDKIMALYERDLPYELAPPDLRTVEAQGIDCDGEIDAPYFAAHYRIFKETDGSNRLIAFCAEEVGQNLKITVWEFDQNMKRRHKRVFEMPNAAFAFQHDMLVTENYYVFIENPIRMDYKKLLTEYMFAKACIAECLTYDPVALKTKIHIVPRPGRKSAGNNLSEEEKVRVIPTPSPFFSFHHANAYEDPTNNRLVIDTCALHDGMDFSANLDTGADYYTDNVGRGTLTRLVVDMAGERVVSQENLIERACEFPSVAPHVVGRKHTVTYCVASRFGTADLWGPPHAVAKVTVDSVTHKATEQIYFPGIDRFAQEPIYVPRSSNSEDDGWVLVLVFDSAVKKTELVILDAKDMKPVATIKLPFMLPAGLHGSFTSTYLGPSDDVAGEYRGSGKVYDIRQGGPLRYE